MLNFGCQISNFKFAQARNLQSRICLRDFDVSFVDPDLDCRRATAIDYLIDFYRGIRSQRNIIKIIGDRPMRGVGDETKGCFGGQKNPCVSLSDIYLRRKFFLFPPIVPEREGAAAHCNIQVRETVANENPAVV